MKLFIIAGAVIVAAGGGIWYYQKSAEPNHQFVSEMPVVPESMPSATPSAPSGQTDQIVAPPQESEKSGIDLKAVTMYSNTLHHFSFNYPKGWNQIPDTPPNVDTMTFAPYPSDTERLEVHMTIGENLNMEQVVQSDAVYYKKVASTIAGISAQKLTFEQLVHHGSSFYMREIHIAVPLSSGKFLNLLGVCHSPVGTIDRCSKTIDEIMNVIVIPSVRFYTSTQDGPPKLKNIGFNLDYYNPATNRAGDFHFTQALASVLSGDPIYQKLIWSDYGIQDNRSPNDPTKRNVQPTFRLPLGTKVLAPIDGIVTMVNILYSNDYTIWFAENSKSTWFYEMEHVINPIVKVGDTVKAGQVVAEVSTHGSEHHAGFGIVEIGLFHQLNNEPAHWCPFVHFDDSIKDEMNKKILALYAAWETYLGDDSVYNNASYPVPGCATLEPTKG